MLPRYLIGPIVLGFLALNLLGQALPLYTDYLWFQEVKFPSVFTTILWYKIALGVAGAICGRSVFGSAGSNSAAEPILS